MSVDIFMCFVVVVFILCKKFRIKMYWEKRRLLKEMKDRYLTSSYLFPIMKSKISCTDFKVV